MNVNLMQTIGVNEEREEANVSLGDDHPGWISDSIKQPSSPVTTGCPLYAVRTLSLFHLLRKDCPVRPVDFLPWCFWSRS